MHRPCIVSERKQVHRHTTTNTPTHTQKELIQKELRPRVNPKCIHTSRPERSQVGAAAASPRTSVRRCVSRRRARSLSPKGSRRLISTRFPRYIFIHYDEDVIHFYGRDSIAAVVSSSHWVVVVVGLTVVAAAAAVAVHVAAVVSSSGCVSKRRARSSSQRASRPRISTSSPRYVIHIYT